MSMVLMAVNYWSVDNQNQCYFASGKYNTFVSNGMFFKICTLEFLS